MDDYLTFQIAEVAVSRQMFADILSDRQAVGAAGASMRGTWSDLRRATAEEEVRPDAGKSAQVSVPVPPTPASTAFCRHQARFGGLPIPLKEARSWQ